MHLCIHETYCGLDFQWFLAKVWTQSEAKKGNSGFTVKLDKIFNHFWTNHEECKQGEKRGGGVPLCAAFFRFL